MTTQQINQIFTGDLVDMEKECNWINHEEVCGCNLTKKRHSYYAPSLSPQPPSSKMQLPCYAYKNNST